MPRIEVTPVERATGLLKAEYDRAISRAGRVWNIVSVMSCNPPVLRDAMQFYGSVMHGPSPLTRRQREMLAVVVSARNHCVY